MSKACTNSSRVTSMKKPISNVNRPRRNMLHSNLEETPSSSSSSSNLNLNHPRPRGRGQGTTYKGPFTRSKATNTAGKNMDSMNYGDLHANGQQDFHSNSQPPESSQQGQYTGAYTVFQPNAEKRQQIETMARRETEAYERFKKERKPRNLNYVGTAGGYSEEHQVRNRQAHDARFTNVVRRQRQEEQRREKKETEEKEVNVMRREARRKAEQNEVRGKTADPQDLRRKREAFLRRLEQGNAG